MQKIFYDKTNNREIVDLSGKQTLAQIKKEYGDADYEQLRFDETVTGYDITDDGLKKYSLEAKRRELESARAERKQLLRQKAIGLKAKLGLSDKEFEDLKVIMKEL